MKQNSILAYNGKTVTVNTKKLHDISKNIKPYPFEDLLDMSHDDAKALDYKTKYLPLLNKAVILLNNIRMAYKYQSYPGHYQDSLNAAWTDLNTIADNDKTYLQLYNAINGIHLVNADMLVSKRFGLPNAIRQLLAILKKQAKLDLYNAYAVQSRTYSYFANMDIE